MTQHLVERGAVPLAAADPGETAGPAGAIPHDPPRTPRSRAPRALVDWGLVAVGVAGAALGLFARGAPAVRQPGAVVQLAVTLVPDDARNLSCASDESFGGHLCAYASSGELARRQGRLLVPAMTRSRQPYLLTGLFEAPAVAGRVAARQGRQTRFTAHCEVKLVTRARVAIRFVKTSAFEPSPNEIWVGEVRDCEVE